MDRKSLVPVTEEEKKFSYYKYFEQEMAPAPQEHYDLMLRGPISPDLALPVGERNRLFEPGYFEEETGWCVMPDGTGYIANLTKMPGVTTDMFDWYFAWHGLNNLRYKIWDREDHYEAVSLNREIALNPKLSYKERLWNTRHDILEDTGSGPLRFFLDFKNPADIGFDASKIGTEACSTIVCGIGTVPEFGLNNLMAHFVREIDGGIELRSRFWMGWKYEDGQDIKTIRDGEQYPEQATKELALHNVKEFTNLAAILPSLYAEERDNWE